MSQLSQDPVKLIRIGNIKHELWTRVINANEWSLSLKRFCTYLRHVSCSVSTNFHFSREREGEEKRQIM